MSEHTDSITRWVCTCQETPVLLGVVDDAGEIHIKMRDRYWHVVGRVRTTCPRCGQEQTIESSAKEHP